MDTFTSIPIDKVFPGVFLAIFLTPIQIGPQKLKGYSVDYFPPPNESRNHYKNRDTTVPVKYLIMHFTVLNFMETLDKFTNNETENRVSAHYVISEREGEIKGGQIVQNVNNGSEKFDEQQFEICGKLSQYLCNDLNINPKNVLGHQDIAPNRKTDPGVWFDWERLFKDCGVGAWLTQEEMDRDYIEQHYHPTERLPLDGAVDPALFLRLLKKYGYGYVTDKVIEKVGREGISPEALEDIAPTIRAFKTHFSANQKPEMINDQITAIDQYWAWALVAKYC
ncbi:n-acetylmuramoyl-L-alanine amidase domain-containing protein [Ditylenchus destructor]|uniref:N-acetylmuramoyl-L-alanine amidase n=1 Tax=Ditylenchus destructor TaxID=166010 RepID=A0AAD4MH16_9BILA|nr:n-acetylmuramoyl-L-alanine amidase domain-containing protein [Ditylenchus destructor]